MKHDLAFLSFQKFCCSRIDTCRQPCNYIHFCFHFILYLITWGVEPAVTHQTSWLESTGVCGVLKRCSHLSILPNSCWVIAQEPWSADFSSCHHVASDKRWQLWLRICTMCAWLICWQIRLLLLQAQPGRPKGIPGTAPTPGSAQSSRWCGGVGWNCNGFSQTGRSWEPGGPYDIGWSAQRKLPDICW